MVNIIHQIWIGTQSPPLFWLNSVSDFARKYNYEYKLWDEDEIKLLEIQNHSIYTELVKAGDIPGTCDILRYEILYKYGGIFIDADSIVLKEEKFNSFLKSHTSQAFFGCETKDCTLYANGVLAIPKHHNFGKALLENLPEYFTQYRNEPNYIRTGPHYLTYVAKKYPNTCTIIPMHVFYPIYWTHLSDPWKHTKLTYNPESLLFQYGYSTNNFNKVFQIRNTVSLFILCAAIIVLLELAQRYKTFFILPYVLFLPFAIFIKYKYIH